MVSKIKRYTTTTYHYILQLMKQRNDEVMVRKLLELTTLVLFYAFVFLNVLKLAQIFLCIKSVKFLAD